MDGEERDNDSGVLDRVRRVIEERWQGNVKAASRDLSLKYDLVLRVVRDGQVPPVRLLAALSEVGRYHPTWLLLGRRPWDDAPAPTVPVFDRLVEWPLKDIPGRQDVETVPVRGLIAGSDVYAFRIPDPHPISRQTLVKGRKLAAGDLLFIEAYPYRAVDRMATRANVVWRWARSVAGPGEPARTELALGELDRAAGVARVFAARTRTFRYSLHAKVGPEAVPPLPPAGGELTYAHLAGTVLGGDFLSKPEEA
jgi:hypothetical protein